jgi:hypothetical protein
MAQWAPARARRFLGFIVVEEPTAFVVGTAGRAGTRRLGAYRGARNPTLVDLAQPEIGLPASYFLKHLPARIPPNPRAAVVIGPIRSRVFLEQNPVACVHEEARKGKAETDPV